MRNNRNKEEMDSRYGTGVKEIKGKKMGGVSTAKRYFQEN